VNQKAPLMGFPDISLSSIDDTVAAAARPASKRQAYPPVALDLQVGGSHYKDMAIQPVEYIHANGIGYFEGCVIKYVSRWRNKNGVEDLHKARHFLDLLIEFEDAQRGGL